MEARRIYVASLADYNAGTLLGRWIDTDKGEEHIWDEIKSLLADSREPVAEEWAIHDCEGFGSLSLSEYADIATVARLSQLIQEHGPVFAELVGYLGGTDSIDEAE